MSGAERICLICLFACEPDDQVVPGERRAICARCWYAHTEAEEERHRMPKGLRREIEAALAGIAHGSWIAE